MTRVYRVQNADTNHRVAYCLGLTDLFLSKAVAGREKDREFCIALLEHRYVLLDQVMELVPRMPIEAEARRASRATIRRWARTIGDDGQGGTSST